MIPFKMRHDGWRGHLYARHVETRPLPGDVGIGAHAGRSPTGAAVTTMRRFQTFARRGRREREVVPEFTDLRLRAEIDLALRLCPAAASRRGRSRPFCRVDFDPVD